MCDRLKTMYDELKKVCLTDTEQKWIDRSAQAYERRGHLTDREYEVFKDIHSRRVHNHTSSSSRGKGRRNRW